MTRSVTATITVEGDEALLAGYRRRVNELLDADSGAPYRELHTPGRLDYRVEGEGVPYPVFVTASEDFPDLVVEVRWEHPAGAAGGSATIRGGRVVDQSSAPGPAAAGARCELRADRDGTLVLGVCCRRRGTGDWIGYAVTASQHAFFRATHEGQTDVLEASDGVEGEWAERWTVAGESVTYAELDPRQPIESRLLGELDRLANDFAAEWVWFADDAPEATAIERQRYGQYGWKVNAANVRAAKLKTALRQTETGAFEFEIPELEAAAVAALVARHWMQAARH